MLPFTPICSWLSVIRQVVMRAQFSMLAATISVCEQSHPLASSFCTDLEMQIPIGLDSFKTMGQLSSHWLWLIR